MDNTYTMLFEGFKTIIQERAEEIADLQATYYIAKAAEETINEIDEEIKRKVLAENEYYITGELWELTLKRDPNAERRITDPKADYKMFSDTDTAQQNDYLDKLYAEYLKAGIADERGRGWIPSAKVRDVRHEAEKALINIVIDLFKNTEYEELFRRAAQHWKYREQLLELILKLKAE